nr:hypothetical protein [uncultured Roseococcus sp.]
MGFDLTRIARLTPAYKIVSNVADVMSPPKPAKAPTGPLEPGDILVKMNDATGLNFLITYGQVFTANGDHALWTHAGLATSSTMIAEMNGEGLQHHNLTGSNAGYTYAVFRCNYRQVALGADEANSVLLGLGRGKVVYSKSGAVSSLLPSLIDSSKKGRLKKALDDIDNKKNLELFCSEHVVFCYLVALEEEKNLPMVNKGPEFRHMRMQEFFDKEPWQYSPGYLYSMLLSNKLFSYMGRTRGAKWIG